MASKIRSERNVSENARKQSRKNASSKLAGKPKQGTLEEKRRELQALLTAEQFRAIIADLDAKEATYEKKRTAANEMRSSAKSVLDKAYTDAAVQTLSRSINRTTLKAIVEAERKRSKKSGDGEAEVKADTTGYVWGLMSLGVEFGEQLDLFADGKDRKKALVRAHSFGAKISAENGNMAEIHQRYTAGSDLHQEAMRGYHDHQASLVNKGKVTNLADAKKDREAKKTQTAASKRKGSLATPPVESDDKDPSEIKDAAE